MKPTLGIAIPTYINHIEHLDRLLRSIGKSTILPDMVSISCSSTNGTLEIPDYGYPIVCHTTPFYKNPSQNRNIAASHLDTDIISFIDGDDLVHPKRNELILKHFSSHNSPLVHGYHMSKDVDEEYLNGDLGKIKHHYDFFNTTNPTGQPLYPLHNGEEYPLANGHLTITKKLFQDYQYDERETARWKEDSLYTRTLVENGIFLSFIENKLSNYIK